MKRQTNQHNNSNNNNNNNNNNLQRSRQEQQVEESKVSGLRNQNKFIEAEQKEYDNWTKNCYNAKKYTGDRNNLKKFKDETYA